jgi:Domain of unknown function (DUF4177)
MAVAIPALCSRRPLKLSIAHSPQKMKQIEYKTVRYEQGFVNRLSGDDFGESFSLMLSEQGREGWDLKAVIRESGMQALLIFSREAA